jgi:hypothetical protein
MLKIKLLLRIYTGHIKESLGLNFQNSELFMLNMLVFRDVNFTESLFSCKKTHP